MENRAVIDRAFANSKHMKNVFKMLVIVLVAIAFTVTASTESELTRNRIEPLPRDLGSGSLSR